MNVIRTKLTEGGRVVIPVELRKKLGMEIGDNLSIELRGDSLQITTGHAALRRIQKLVRKHVPAGVSLVDELIAERREEARNE